jgi:tetratricopeptide (TPR) repeat protein
MAGYTGTEKGIPEIARELDVDGVILGSVFREGDSLEIAVRLFDRDEQELWAGTFDGVLPNIVAMYRGFARAIADEIRLALDPGDEARLAEAVSVNPAVYEAYLRGMQFIHDATAIEHYDSAVVYFQEAVGQNPADALAWAGLADCYVTLGHDKGVGNPELWSNALAAAERAIRLDSTLAEGWAALAVYQSYHGRDWEAAEEAFRKANELNPSLAWNHYHYSWYLILFGRLEEAVAEHERAKALDPLTPAHTTWLPALYFWSGDFDRAHAEARELVEGPYADDMVANFVLGRSAAYAGSYQEAIAVYQKLAALYPLYLVDLGEAYALAGEREEALRIAREVEARPAIKTWFDSSLWDVEGLFCIHAFLGNRKEALRWLEHEPASHSLPWVWAYPEVDALRDDPRFRAVFRRMNLRFVPGQLAPVPISVDDPGRPGGSG